MKLFPWMGLVLLKALPAVSQTDAGFRVHATFKGIGSCLSTVIGPGPKPGAERLYASHVYGGDLLEIVAVDPLTGETDVFPSPVPGQSGAWAMALGPDGHIYVGTLPAAHVLRLDWGRRALVDLGRPSATEQYIWQFALGSDKKLYGCTYPSAKLVRFDPTTGKGEDLGRMDEKELYARSVAADAAGFVYVGIGMETRHLVAYEIATGGHRDILPAELGGAGACSVHRGDDGQVYGVAGDKHLRLEGWKTVVIQPTEYRPAPELALADRRRVSYDGRSVALRNPGGEETASKPVAYEGRSQSLFRIAFGPDGRLYGSTAMPIHFLWADPDSDRWEEIGQPGSGEFYSFLAHKDVLIGAAYGGMAPVMIYRPGEPYAPDAKPSGNPWLIHYQGENSGWRPMAMVAGPGNKVYIGAVSGYGLLGGPLCVFDPATGALEQHMHMVKDQSVVALALLPNGLIAGGTTIGGGGGSHPTQTEAKLFLWDPATGEKVFETVPAPGQGQVDALAVGPDRLVYVFAGGALAVFDPATRKMLETLPHGLGQVVYNAVGPGPDGALIGLASGGVFAIDADTRRPRILATYPGGIDGGFALRGRRVLFTSGPRIVSYTLP